MEKVDQTRNLQDVNGDYHQQIENEEDKTDMKKEHHEMESRSNERQGWPEILGQLQS
jgi:hypothetical protein